MSVKVSWEQFDPVKDYSELSPAMVVECQMAMWCEMARNGEPPSDLLMRSVLEVWYPEQVVEPMMKELGGVIRGLYGQWVADNSGNEKERGGLDKGSALEQAGLTPVGRFRGQTLFGDETL